MNDAVPIDVRVTDNGCVLAKFYGEEAVVYRFPYKILKSRQAGFDVDNPFYEIRDSPGVLFFTEAL
jgi:hypothetical protein